MWWSKQAQSATPSFSPAFSSTGTIDSPLEAPASQPANTTPYPSVAPRSDRVPRRDVTPRDVTPRDDLRLDTVIEGAISLNCQRLTIEKTAKATADVVAREVIVYGELTGHLQAADRIEIKEARLGDGRSNHAANPDRGRRLLQRHSPDREEERSPEARATAAGLTSTSRTIAADLTQSLSRNGTHTHREGVGPPESAGPRRRRRIEPTQIPPFCMTGSVAVV